MRRKGSRKMTKNRIKVPDHKGNRGREWKWDFWEFNGMRGKRELKMEGVTINGT